MTEKDIEAATIPEGDDGECQHTVPTISHVLIRTSHSDGDNYDDPSSKLWSVYVSEALQYDKALIESWKGDMDGILIFVRSIFFFPTGYLTIDDL